MSTTTYWLIFVAALVLDYPLNIIRWPLSFAIIVGDSIYFQTGDLERTIVISLPVLIIFLVIQRVIRKYKEADAICRLNGH